MFQFYRLYLVITSFLLYFIAFVHFPLNHADDLDSFIFLYHFIACSDCCSGLGVVFLERIERERGRFPEEKHNSFGCGVIDVKPPGSLNKQRSTYLTDNYY